MLVRETGVQRLLKAVQTKSVATTGVTEVHVGATISLGSVHATGRYRLNRWGGVNEGRRPWRGYAAISGAQPIRREGTHSAAPRHLPHGVREGMEAYFSRA
jgi:hypothetical protein